MAFAMTRAEREAFLGETRVGILAISEEGRGPLAVPVWYAYAPGQKIRIVVATRSRKGELVRLAGRVSLCVQSEEAPYRYVSIEGPVTLGKVDFDRDERQMAHRYIGEASGERFLAATEAERLVNPNILIELEPERWYAVDYRKAPFWE